MAPKTTPYGECYECDGPMPCERHPRLCEPAVCYDCREGLCCQASGPDGTCGCNPFSKVP